MIIQPTVLDYHDNPVFEAVMFKREVGLPNQNSETFFLWGSRQTGKSTLLRSTYPNALFIDLLNNREFARFSADPHARTEQLKALSTKPSRIIIDEVQKIPALLDEEHLCIESLGLSFALCGSSARKVRRGHANLLGGRALRYELFGLVSKEVGFDAFEPLRFLNHGVLPKHYLSSNPRRWLNAYIADYLKEEIANEGLVRNLPAFSDFLWQAAISDTEILNYENIARECGIAATTVKSHYEILEDTLLAMRLPAFAKRAKRRVIQAPKFYFRDVAVVNTLLKRGPIEPGSEVFGKALENWIFHEIAAHASYSPEPYDISYWRLASGVEVDFVLGDARCAIEVKGVDRIRKQHLNGLLSFREEFPAVEELVIVSLEQASRRLDNGILVCSLKDFCERLWTGSFPH